jgi:predicted ABC-type ATPase
LPTFTVVAGANGAGKSTLTRLGREGFQECAVLDPDAVARSMQRLGVRSASPIDAGRSVLEMAEGYLKSGSSFLIETTLSGNTYLRMMSRAKERGYLVVLLYVGTADVSINIQRVKIRVLKGGHDVPVEDQLRRYPRSLANLRKALELADEAIVFDNSTPKGHTKVAVKDANGFEIFEPVAEWAAFLQSTED